VTSCIFLLIIQLELNSFIVALTYGEDFTSPLPIQLTLTIVGFLIENTAGTHFLADDGSWLKPIRENDIRVHGTHINMVDQGLCRNGWTLDHQGSQFSLNLIFYFLVVCDLRLVLVTRLYKQGKVHNRFCLINEHLICLLFQLKLNWDITPVDTLLQTFDMATNISFSVNQFAFVELLVVLHLFVRKYDITPESLSHQQVLTQCSRTSTQNIVRVSRDNCAESKNKVMNLCHVQKVSGNRIGDRVLSQVLWSFFSVLNHQFRVELNWVIP